MAGTMVHLVAAARFMKQFSEGENVKENSGKPCRIKITEGDFSGEYRKCSPLFQTDSERGMFISGAVAPDAIMSEKGYTRAMKMHTHFRDGIPDREFGKKENLNLFQKRLMDFCDERLGGSEVTGQIKAEYAGERNGPDEDSLTREGGVTEKEIINIEKKAADTDKVTVNTEKKADAVNCRSNIKEGIFEFYLGYIVHMITDELFMLKCRPVFFRNAKAAGIDIDDPSVFDVFSKDTDAVDFRLAADAPESGYIKSVLENVKGYSVPGLISGKALEDSRVWALNRYFYRRPGCFRAKYLTYENMEQFIKNTVDALLRRITPC